MLKTDIRIIIRRVIIAVIVAMILCFLRDIKVLAASITPTSSVFDVRYTTLYCDRYDSLGNCIYDSWGNWNGQQNIGTAITAPSGVSDAWNTIGFTYQFNTSLVSGNTYTVINKVQLGPTSSVFVDRSWNIINRYFQVWSVVAGTTSANRSPDNVSSFSYQLRRDQNNNNIFYITTSFTLQKNSNYISFYLRDESYGKWRSYLDYLQEVNVYYVSTSWTYSESSNSYIQQNTQEIINQTKEIIKIFNLNTEELDYLKDDTDASVDVSGMSGITGLLPPGPLDSLLSIPITILNIFIDSTAGTCTPFSFNFVFNQQFELPCFDMIWEEVPTALMLFLSDLPAVLLFIKWAKSVYKRVERAVSFESTVDDEWGGV